MNIKPLYLLAILVCFLTKSVSACSSISSCHQSENVKLRKNMRNARYGEILLVTGGPFSFTGHVYNTLGLNDCPESLWKQLNPEKLKKEYSVKNVILNGPRYFLMDECSILNPGKVVSFEGLRARLLATVSISLGDILRGASHPYTETRVARTTCYFFKKGNILHELISPQGRRYVMQSYSLEVDPHLTEKQLLTLGSKLRLPSGWRYEVHPLEHDYKMQTAGVAYVLQDDLKNSYQRQ